MEFVPSTHETRLENAKEKLAELALASELAQEQLRALEWQGDLLDTTERGGRARSEAPYDIVGAWRMLKVDDETVVYKTVLALEEVPSGVDIERPVVGAHELATGACECCDLEVPLIGRSRGVDFQQDIGVETSVAVVHCDTVQIRESDISSNGGVFRPSARFNTL